MIYIIGLWGFFTIACYQFFLWLLDKPYRNDVIKILALISAISLTVVVYLAFSFGSNS